MKILMTILVVLFLTSAAKMYIIHHRPSQSDTDMHYCRTNFFNPTDIDICLDHQDRINNRTGIYVVEFKSMTDKEVK